jgi:Ca-activated chloride channel family protein
LFFLDNIELQNRVGLITFNTDVTVEIDLLDLETNKPALQETIGSLRAERNTALYDAIIQAVGMYEDDESNRIRAIVLLSDGADTASVRQLREARQVIEERHGDLNPVIVIPVAYGSDADIQTLNSIARASATKVQSGDPANILQVLEIISSYF